MAARVLRIKDPSLRSEYTHPLLQRVEDLVDDFRDSNGDAISYEEMDDIVRKASSGGCDGEVGDGELLRELSFDNFVELDGPVEDGPVEGGLEYGPSSGAFPEYRQILPAISKLGDEWWASYDQFVHDAVSELFCDVCDESLAAAVGGALKMHEESFDETGDLVPRLALFVLKTCVPCREDSEYQNSVYRIESLWAGHGILPGGAFEDDVQG